MAYIIEQAGGLAYDDHQQRILDLQPTNIHERSPVFMGSKEDVQDVLEMYKKYPK